MGLDFGCLGELAGGLSRGGAGVGEDEAPRQADQEDLGAGPWTCRQIRQGHVSPFLNFSSVADPKFDIIAIRYASKLKDIISPDCYFKVSEKSSKFTTGVSEFSLSLSCPRRQ